MDEKTFFLDDESVDELRKQGFRDDEILSAERLLLLRGGKPEKIPVWLEILNARNESQEREKAERAADASALGVVDFIHAVNETAAQHRLAEQIAEFYTGSAKL